MNPTPQWLQQYSEVKHLLVPPYNLETYFEQDEIAGIPLQCFSVGEVSVPSGEILVRDPLAWFKANGV